MTLGHPVEKRHQPSGPEEKRQSQSRLSLFVCLSLSKVVYLIMVNRKLTLNQSALYREACQDDGLACALKRYARTTGAQATGTADQRVVGKMLIALDQLQDESDPS